MPHAALWVVQQDVDADAKIIFVFQCRTRLCGWCSLTVDDARRSFCCFNAARGFVGGATSTVSFSSDMSGVSMPHAALWVVQLLLFDKANSLAFSVSMPHAALWVVQREHGSGRSTAHFVSMPHAALWVVQRRPTMGKPNSSEVSMPHAALWVVQPGSDRCRRHHSPVSMPHAALWVVQL